MKEKTHVILDEAVTNEIIEFVKSKNYKDYDVGDCVIKHTISYFYETNPLTESFKFQVQIERELGLDGSEITNLWLIHKYQDLLYIYDDFKSDIYEKSEYLQQFDYVNILNYVLYIMGINDITTITLNLLGIKKKEL